MRRSEFDFISILHKISIYHHGSYWPSLVRRHQNGKWHQMKPVPSQKCGYKEKGTKARSCFHSKLMVSFSGMGAGGLKLDSKQYSQLKAEVSGRLVKELGSLCFWGMRNSLSSKNGRWQREKMACALKHWSGIQQAWVQFLAVPQVPWVTFRHVI